MDIRMLAAALLAVQVAAPAWAQAERADGPVRCFGRAYDVAHMNEHSGQRVVEMLLVLRPYTYDGRDYADATVRAMLRDRSGAFVANSAICDMQADGSYACGIECDGGQFDVAFAADGTATLRNEDYGFVLFGGCGEEVESEEVVRIESDAEHSAFRLYPLPVEACPVDMWEVYDFQ